MKQPTDWTKITLYIAAGVTAIVLGASIGALLYSPGGSSRWAVSADSPQSPFGGPFELTDKNGERKNEKILLGRVSLVYFGFTHCPDYCPLELANLTAAKAQLKGSGLTPQIIFISVDPERDTPKVLKGYVDYFDPAIIALTGAPKEIAAVARGYRVAYRKAPVKGSDDYAVDHSTSVYAMGPDGRFLARFDAKTDPAVIAKTLLEKSGLGKTKSSTPSAASTDG
ncbi:MAG: SCO family protein [Neomegalonema sp.]|nr:SCO family protein [Neomegalonema sp.]